MHRHPSRPRLSRPTGRAATHIEIHPLRDQAESLFTLAEWLYSEWYQPVGDSREDALETMVTRMNRFSLPTALVAVEDGEPAGMVSLAWNECPSGRETPCLAGLYVIPEKRGPGIGTLLCHRAMQQAAEMGFPSLALFTPDRASFYRRLGWTQVGWKAFRGPAAKCAYMRSHLLPISATPASAAA